MQSSKIRRDKRTHSKKEKLSKLIKNDTDSDGGESEHELSHYLNDRVKLMKEVLKIIKPKKIRTMAPDCMQNLDSEEINSMLLDELLGISKKRLKYIFNGQTLNEESSSSDSEEEQTIDIISLDDISDDEFIIDLDSDTNESRKKHKRHKTKIKEEPKKKRVKKEKSDKTKIPEEPQNQMSEQNLMSVLELLELQARARAIRSQIVLENNKKAEEAAKVLAEVESSDNEDAVIVESPENVEIVIASSDSENENLQQEPNHQFRKSTDDSPEENSKEAPEITQKSITDGESESHAYKNRNEITKTTPNGTEELSRDGNIDTTLPKRISDQLDNDLLVADSTKETDTNGSEEQMVEVVHIPLPKDKNDHSSAILPVSNENKRGSREQQPGENTKKSNDDYLKCRTESSKTNSNDSVGMSNEKSLKESKSLNEKNDTAPPVSTEEITRGSREQQSPEDTKKSKDSKLKCRKESKSNANPTDSIGISNEKGSKESKTSQEAAEKPESKLLKESDNSISKSASPEASSPVKDIPSLKIKTTSQEVKVLMGNDNSKGQKNESNTESDTKKDVGKADHGSKKEKSPRICRRKLSKLAKEKAVNLENAQKASVTSRNKEKHPVKDKNRTEESDGIILNVDQSEMDCIHLD